MLIFPAKMEHKREKLSCRICLSERDDSQPTWPLFKASGVEQKTLADIIQHCFGVEVPKSTEVDDEICTNCKTDLDAAYRFSKLLHQSVENLKRVAPKVESGIFHDNEAIFIPEVEIKVENSEGSAEQTNKKEDLAVLEEVRPKRGRPKKKPEIVSTPPKGKPSGSTKRKSQPKKITPIKPEVPSSSDDDDDRNGDNDYGQNPSSDDDDDHDKDEDEEYEKSDKPARKRKRRPIDLGPKLHLQPKRCCLCKEPLDSHEQAQKHSDQYHLNARVTNPKEFGDRVFECLVCYQRFDSQLLFRRHQRKMYVDQLYPCTNCKEEFANAFVLRKHIKYDHNKQFKQILMEEQRLKSNMCCGCKDAKFPTAEALKEHTEKMHAKDQKPTDPSHTVQCDVCYNWFKDHKMMKHHQWRFFKEKKYVCTLCGKYYREKHRLAEHENMHRKIAPLQCPHCPAKFAIKNSYKVHVKMHSQEQIFHCEHCGRGFQKKTLLQSHLHVHDADRPFKCHLCPIAFTRQNLLDSHLLAHSDAKPHKCQQCAASYIHQRDLRRHIREKHEGVRGFPCHLCPKAYIRQKLLEAHLKSHVE